MTTLAATTFNVITILVTSGILIPTWGALLWRVVHGSKFAYVRNIAILLLINNVSWFGVVAGFFYYESILMVVVYAISEAVCFSAFNVGHWLFAREYYQLSIKMPFVLKKQDPPASQEKTNRTINWVMQFFNLLGPLVLSIGTLYAGISHVKRDKIPYPSEILAITGPILISLIQIASALFLGLGVFKIRKTINESGSSSEINVKLLIQHFLAFGLYLLSTSVTVVFYAILIVSNESNRNQYLYAQGICNLVSFFAQLCLVWILWKLAVKEERPQPEQHEKKAQGDRTSS